MGKKIIQFAAILFAAFICLSGVVSAADAAEQDVIRVGLFYGSSALPGANLLNDAYHLMPYGDARHCPGNATVLDVQIAGADAAERHADNGVAGGFQPGFRFFYKFKFSVFNISICKHCFSLF